MSRYTEAELRRLREEVGIERRRAEAFRADADREAERARRLLHAGGKLAQAITSEHAYYPEELLEEWHRAIEDTPPLAEHEAIHEWFGLTYANYLVLNRSLLQSMPDVWQTRFVGCLRELDRAFGHLEHPTYSVQCLAREREHVTSENCESCDGEGVRLDGDLPAEPAELCADCYGEGQVERWETDEEVGVITDPIPHYDRGRTRVEART